jgi:hypothetical protein
MVRVWSLGGGLQQQLSLLCRLRARGAGPTTSGIRNGRGTSLFFTMTVVNLKKLLKLVQHNLACQWSSNEMGSRVRPTMSRLQYRKLLISFAVSGLDAHYVE